MNPDEMLAEMKKHVDACMGAECAKIREELSKRPPPGLTDEQLKVLLNDLEKRVGTKVVTDYEEHMKAMQSRVSQYGTKVDRATERMETAVSKIDEAQKALTDQGKVVVDAIADLKGKTASPPIAPSPPIEPQKPVTPPPPTMTECPNCGYKKVTERPKVAMGCPTCGLGFTSYEVDPPKEDGTGGMGYKFCPGCGGALIPADEAKKALAQKKEKK